jgi:hypothetical protein
MQACEAADRVGRLAAKIDADGELIETKSGPRIHPGVKEELAGRAFICRTLHALDESYMPSQAVGSLPTNRMSLNCGAVHEISVREAYIDSAIHAQRPFLVGPGLARKHWKEPLICRCIDFRV